MLILDFSQITLADLPRVGGKNSSLGEMFNALAPKGIPLVDGFATTADAWRLFLDENDLAGGIEEAFRELDVDDVAALARAGAAVRERIGAATLPQPLVAAVRDAYDRLMERMGGERELAVRSSATAEDLPEASFAGQQETYLNVTGVERLLDAVHRCFASLYTDRAISYRAEHGFGQLEVALSVGVQPMVRSDRASAGVLFTLDTESGFRDVVTVTGAYGLGESVVQGAVDPDEWRLFKPTLAEGFDAIVGRRRGTKETRLVYDEQGHGTRREDVPADDRRRFVLTDEEVQDLGRWAIEIERHYSELAGAPRPMDIEWAKDGVTGKIFILQARPETVHARRTGDQHIAQFHLTGRHGPPRVVGQAVGERIASGTVRVVTDPSHLEEVRPGDVLVAPITDPDWEPVMRRVAAIVTDAGGRTAHAAIVSRELGLPCIVGTGNGTQTLADGDRVTVSCAEGSEGHVYDGEIAFEVEEIDLGDLPPAPVRMMLITGDPSQAFRLSMLPGDGVGLARLEFIVARHIGVHPMALVRYPDLADAEAVREIAERLGDEEPTEYFVRRLSEGVATIAAAFHPRPVIVRMSDFKTNEYARLVGGGEFEPEEENPMLGFRGASRYYDPRYAEGFALECRAMDRVRRVMGLRNVKLMIPFCRSVEEGRRVIAEMAKHGLRQGEEELQIWAMCELPTNAILAEEFLEVFDGLSIGSNDLTQLVLGIDRDSGTIAHLFDERDAAVKRMIALAIEAARRVGKPIGICGQAPSDHPDFAAWLVEQGISSISVNPDAVVKTRRGIAEGAGVGGSRGLERLS